MWVLAAAGLAVWVVVAISSAGNKTSNNTATKTPPSLASSPTTTSVDGDEVPDPSAVGAKAPQGAATIPAATGPSCRSGNPLANVYHPSRLHVIKTCTTVTGVVKAVRSEQDGDIHVNVALDPAYAGLINERNVSGEQGALVTEIVPADEPGCTPGQPPRPASGGYDYGVCSGADETAPGVGEHVAVTGPYVLDADHGWMEIHPVWSIAAAGIPAPTPTAAPPTSAAPATQPPSTGPAPAPTGTTITSSPGTVSPGQTASLTAQTSPGTSCTLSVTLPSGAQSTSSGLGTAVANSAGSVSWSWKIGTRTNPGTATATVSCSTGSAEAQFQIT